MAEVEKIKYTPEEEQEIIRIKEFLTQNIAAHKAEKENQALQKVEKAAESDEPDFPEFTQGEIPDSLFNNDIEEDSEDEIEQLSESDLEALTEVEEGSNEPEEFDFESLGATTEEVPASEENLPEEDNLDFNDLALSDESVSPAFTEEPVSSVSDGDEIPEIVSEKMTGLPGNELNTLDELDALTSGEPQSIDRQDIAEELVGEFNAGAGADIFSSPVSPENNEVRFDEVSGFDLPNFDDMQLEAGTQLQEASDDDIPDLQLDSMSGVDDILSASSPISEGSTDFLTDLDSDNDFISSAGISPSDLSEIDSSSPLSMESAEDYDFSQITPIGEEETSVPPPVEKPKKEKKAKEAAPPSGGDSNIELSDRELKKLKKALQKFSPEVVRIIKDIILNDRLTKAETSELIKLILDGKSDAVIRVYIERKLGAIPEEPRLSGFSGGRRVISSRPEYSPEGRQRQQKLLKYTKIGAGVAAGLLVALVLSYQFVYKPVMAKRTIDEGVRLILKPGDRATEKVAHYQEAEVLFDKVKRKYNKQYIYGYTSYSRAYFTQKEYYESLKKLNLAYEFAPRNIEILNGLGKYYSRVPAKVYEVIAPSVRDMYFKNNKILGAIDSQLNLAIEFYRRALASDKANVTAMVGIGNAYFYQGEYLKAREYYEGILKLDPKSIAGYSGLLNLFIELDYLPETMKAHIELRNKKLLKDIPSPLLAKLADYYLSKKAKGGHNLRIDYGLQSGSMLDLEDNPYPAVKEVLQTLKNRDREYPPLYVQFAKLAAAQDNISLMKVYLDEAVKYADKKNENYFGALHLLGEYYYKINEPVESYNYLKRAEQAYLEPASFTYEDFYKETESIGKNYAVMGNIFYYFLDKVDRFTADELAETQTTEESDRVADYEIARQKYEQAMASGYKSPELFYNLGRIYYQRQQYDQALQQWLNLYDDFANKPELMLSLGNAFYHMGNYDSSLGEYKRLVSIYEYEASKIKRIIPSREDHRLIYVTLSAACNNAGAVYQKKNSDSNSSLSYWKSLDYAGKIGNSNEYARINQAQLFSKGMGSFEPILDENIPLFIDSYRNPKN